MPVMDGYTWVSAFRAWEREAVERQGRLRQFIVGMTANDTEGDFRHATQVGMNCIMPKPLNKECLLGVASSLRSLAGYLPRG